MDFPESLFAAHGPYSELRALADREDGPRHLAVCHYHAAGDACLASRYVGVGGAGPGCNVPLLPWSSYVVLRTEGDRVILLASPPGSTSYDFWVGPKGLFLPLCGITEVAPDGDKSIPTREYTPDVRPPYVPPKHPLEYTVTPMTAGDVDDLTGFLRGRPGHRRRRAMAELVALGEELGEDFDGVIAAPEKPYFRSSEAPVLLGAPGSPYSYNPEAPRSYPGGLPGVAGKPPTPLSAAPPPGLAREARWRFVAKFIPLPKARWALRPSER